MQVLFRKNFDFFKKRLLFSVKKAIIGTNPEGSVKI